MTLHLGTSKTNNPGNAASRQEQSQRVSPLVAALIMGAILLLIGIVLMRSTADYSPASSAGQLSRSGSTRTWFQPPGVGDGQSPNQQNPAVQNDPDRANMLPGAGAGQGPNG